MLVINSHKQTTFHVGRLTVASIAKVIPPEASSVEAKLG